MVDKIIIRNTDSEAKLGGVQATDVLNGEMLLVREVDKERLYCKNSDGEISKIHRITNCGGFESEKDYVDLGLPSGLLWAKKNIGAKTEEDDGLYFAFGETVGYTAEQVGVDKLFVDNGIDYKFGYVGNAVKYNSSDGLKTLEPEDDAATQIMGSDWRMPTYRELMELITNTNIYIVLTDGSEYQGTYTGVYRQFTFPEAETMKGMKFYNKFDHSKYIFIPSAGYFQDGVLHSSGVGGRLLSSSLGETNYSFVWNIYFNSSWGYGGLSYNLDRNDGLSIRGVKSPQ